MVRTGESILVADDGSPALAHAASICARDYRVSSCRDTALGERLKEALPGLVMANPLVNSFASIRQAIAGLQPGGTPPGVPLLAVTSPDCPVSLRVRVLDEGVSDLIILPMAPDELLARVRRVLKTSDLVTSLISRQDALLEMTNLDELTGMHNRRFLAQHFDRELARARRYHRPLGCLMLDLDHFKQINDTYGHLTGDRVLSSFSSLLRTLLRESDLVARFGGEEFVILLPETDLIGSVEVAEKIKMAASGRSFDIGTDRVVLTTSIGVTVTDGDETTEDVISRADTALYKAKIAGRNRVCMLAK